MAASFPAGIKSFGTAHQDFTENILAAHVNDLQNEVVAIETNLGVVPNQGIDVTGTLQTYATVKARMDANIAAVRSHTHDGTSGVKLLQANTHQSPDTDAAAGSLHHTIGVGANQAASGSHTHVAIPSSSVTGLDAHTASTASHGATGAVVGTTNTQTLFNKTLDTATTVFPANQVTTTGAQALTNKDLTGAGNTFPATLATLTGAQVLTAKSIDGGTNTLTNIAQASVTGLPTLQTNYTAHAAATIAHGTSGPSVGTTDVQTLTNKDLSSATNTFAAANILPPGMVVPFAGAGVPTGWLLCNGQAVSRTTFAALFAAISTAHGNGDGTTTFNVPNMTGRVPVARDVGQTEFDTLGEVGGLKTHTLAATEMPVHTHTIDHDHGAVTSSDISADHSHSGHTAAEDSVHNHTIAGDVGGLGGGGSLSRRGGAESGNLTGTENQNHGHAFSTSGATNGHTHIVDLPFFGGSSGGAGSGGAHNNLQPYLVLNYIIKT